MNTTPVPSRRALALASVGHDAEIVIGELEVIFLRHAVAIEVRVVRQLLVFFQKLRRIAPCPAVAPVQLLAAALLAIVAATAPAVITTIVVQG